MDLFLSARAMSCESDNPDSCEEMRGESSYQNSRKWEENYRVPERLSKGGDCEKLGSERRGETMQF